MTHGLDGFISRDWIGNPDAIQIIPYMYDSHTTTLLPRLQLCKVINIAPSNQAISSLGLLDSTEVTA